MSERLGLFAAPKHPVLSLSAQSIATVRRAQSQFEVLVRHLLHRFLHNELLGSDDETKRVMQFCCLVALPPLVVSLFLFPSYHAFPPAPYPRPFWSQVSDHYFYVMYAFIAMGAATAYEWDLLFPDLLDIFVLSVLPITNRRLFLARVLALAVFLAFVLVGTNLLGALSLPLVADLPNASRLFLAHAIAITFSGTFAAATLLGLQGVLLNTIGESLFRRITPLLQGSAVLLCLAILLLFPAISTSIQPILTSGSTAVFYFPPFWFLGVYERVLAGPATLPVFIHLSHAAYIALSITLTLSVATYPLAYRRRVRQLVEGAQATTATSRATLPLRSFLHGSIVRTPAQRAIFHFIGQTVLRPQRQRVILAMYGGLGVALALANMLVFSAAGGHVHPSLLPYGIRAAVPIVAFWTVAGLSAVLATPIDLRGAWLFRTLVGRPQAGHLTGSRHWITLWTLLISLTTVVVLHLLAPHALRSPLADAAQIVIAIAISYLLPDVYLFRVRSIPFTCIHNGAITDLPLMVLRNVVLFPLFVFVLIQRELWIEASITHLLFAIVLFLLAHRLFRAAHHRYLNQFTVDAAPDDTEDFPQTLGLRDT